MESYIKAAEAHVFVDQEAFVADLAVAEKGDEVAMLDLANGLHLGCELTVPLAGDVNELLDGDDRTIFETGVVDFAEAAGADETLRAEVACGFDQMGEGELPQVFLEGGDVDAEVRQIARLDALNVASASAAVSDADCSAELFRFLSTILDLEKSESEGEKDEDGERNADEKAEAAAAERPPAVAVVGIRGTGRFIAGFKRDAAESRIILVARGRESGELARSRDLAAEVVIGNIEVVKKSVGPKRSRDRAGEIVVREIEHADRLQTSERVGDWSRERVMAQIENYEGFHGAEDARDFACKKVVREVQIYHAPVSLEGVDGLSLVDSSGGAGVF
ncbi:hypothetical protein IEQ34_022740 [Dendrobium chrysotoxum]|uniref:Uncharacterized protein n=1 Tax=Dendrobium chrysotoxum TaxID=161865 RepID=A0AAV7FZV2_DENCH|nr:hypothetical protein IEQ34_022740 [Dendrobium chrysotoxum]